MFSLSYRQGMGQWIDLGGYHDLLEIPVWLIGRLFKLLSGDEEETIGKVTRVDPGRGVR